MILIFILDEDLILQIGMGTVLSPRGLWLEKGPTLIQKGPKKSIERIVQYREILLSWTSIILKSSQYFAMLFISIKLKKNLERTHFRVNYFSH